ncbi:unnamed protein product [Rhodiola kirilowii]
MLWFWAASMRIGHVFFLSPDWSPQADTPAFCLEYRRPRFRVWLIKFDFAKLCRLPDERTLGQKKKWRFSMDQSLNQWLSQQLYFFRRICIFSIIYRIDIWLR